jgi:phosphomevalonate kinase
MTMKDVKAPGKVFLAGEYAVLEPGRPALVAAIDRFITCHVHEAEAASPQKDLPSFPGLAAEMAVTFLKQSGKPGVRPFLNFTSQLEEQGVKIGIGSSAASSAAAAGAVLARNGLDVREPATREKAFRLAAMAHVLTQQGGGSGADTAAAALGGILEYRRYDVAWLWEHLSASRVDMPRIMSEPWPGLKWRALKWPAELRFVLLWTGMPASSPDLTRATEIFRLERPDEWKVFCDQSEAACDFLASALESRDPSAIAAGIEEAGDCIFQLARDSDVELVTAELKRALEAAKAAGAPAKIAGAGGGDCALAVAFDEDAVARLVREAESRLLVAYPVRIAEGLSWA